jgi:hypothetical protein
VSLAGRSGAALLLVLIALLLASALAAAGASLGLKDRRAVRDAVGFVAALHAAEEGAALQLEAWRTAGHHRMEIGEWAAFEGSARVGGARFEGRVLRLGRLLYLVESEGRSAGGEATQRVGLLVRPRPLELGYRAALESAGPVSLASLATVNGQDLAPPWWLCPAPESARTGLRLPSDAPLDTSSCSAGPCLAGAPPVLRGAAADGSLPAWATQAAAEIRSLADKRVQAGSLAPAPRTSSGDCLVGDPTNWGDPDAPASACGEHFPVIHARGNLELVGGRGQGVLLVDGDLTVRGGFRFHGAVVVNGHLTTTSEGGHFKGGVVAAKVVLAQNAPGAAAVGFSSCSLDRALAASATGERLVDRGWLRLTRTP